jgi:C-22 sterol desaturase
MVNMANLTGSFVSPSADATVSPQLFAPTGLVATLLDGFTLWKGLLTFLVAAVLYDQCKCNCHECDLKKRAWKLI